MKKNKYNFVPFIFALLVIISIGYIVYLNFFDNSTDQILTFKSSSVDVNDGNEYDLKKEIYQDNIKPGNIVWVSSNEEIASVNDSGVLTLLSNGTVEIIAKNRFGIESSIFVKVNVANIGVKKLILNESNITSSAGSKRVITTNMPSSNIVWESSNTDVADVSATGVIAFKKEGTATIIAKTSNGQYAECKVIVTEKIKEVPVSKIEIEEKSITLNIDSSMILTISIYPEDATNQVITWSSSNTNIVSVSPTGLVTAVGLGRATIAAKSNNGKEAKVEVFATQEVKDLKIVDEKVSLTIGWQKQLSVIIKPENAVDKNLIWTSSNENIVTVNNTGLITAKKAGTAIITVNSNNGITKQIEVIVNNSIVEVNSISINSVNFSLDVGFSKDLDIIMQPSNATVEKVTWTSSNITVVSVNNDGLVFAKNSGTATITAKTDNGKTATVNVTVNKNINVDRIEINQNNFSLILGTQKQLSATISPSNATNKDITWSSNDTSIAIVSNTGLVTGIKSGIVTITAKSNNGKQASITVTVEPKEVIVTAVILNMGDFQIEIGNTKQIIAIISPNNATNKTVTWSSSDTSIAIVSNTGLVTGIKSGTTTITAKSNNGKQANLVVTVYKIYDPLNIYLSPNGNDNNDGLSENTPILTLKKAQNILNDLSNNKTYMIKNININIKEGRYVENSIKVHSVSWTYENPGYTITFSGTSPSNVPVFVGKQSDVAYAWMVLNADKSKFIFKNIKIENYFTGLNLSKTNDNLISNVYFYKIGDYYTTPKDTSLIAYAAIILGNSSNNIIENCVFKNIENRKVDGNYPGLIHAIYVSQGSSNNNIKNNTFTLINGDPIRVRNNSNNNIAQNNTFTKTGLKSYMSEWYCKDRPANSPCSTGSTVDEDISINNVFKNNILIGVYNKSEEKISGGYGDLLIEFTRNAIDPSQNRISYSGNRCGTNVNSLFNCP